MPSYLLASAYLIASLCMAGLALPQQALAQNPAQAEKIQTPQIAEDTLAQPALPSEPSQAQARASDTDTGLDKLVSVKATSPIKLEIEVHYPQLNIPAVDAQVAKWANNMSANFQENVTKEAQKDDTTAYELLGKYTVSRPSAMAVSITYEMWSYTGGAHGNLDIITLNFDCETGALLTLEHIFNDVEQALELMSTYCYTVLNAELGSDNAQEMLKSGTSPDTENFSAITLNPEGIIVHFQPYQVAPWSAGPRKVSMTVDELSNAQPQLELWGRKKAG